MNKFIFAFAAIVVLSISTSFQAAYINPTINPNPTFIDSEELKYVLHYGFISAGEAVISLKQETLNSKSVFHAVAKANTTGLTEKLFKVLDIYESYFEPASNLPLKTIRNIHEGNYKQYNEVLFDHEKNMVKSQLSGDHKVPVNFLDMVYIEIMKNYSDKTVKVSVLGFSQGTATACRWLVNSKVKVDKLILWGGTIPPEINTEVSIKILEASNLSIVIGDKDEFIEETTRQHRRNFAPSRSWRRAAPA